MKVLSLFDGMSCGRIALDQLGIPVEKYYASEIDKYAIQVSQANYPDIEQVGDICDLDPKDYKDVDLMLAGSPCQGFSFAGKQLAFDDPRSALFFEFIRLLKAIKPKYFLLENVRMRKEGRKTTSTKPGSTYQAPDPKTEIKGLQEQPPLWAQSDPLGMGEKNPGDLREQGRSSISYLPSAPGDPFKYMFDEEGNIKIADTRVSRWKWDTPKPHQEKAIRKRYTGSETGSLEEWRGHETFATDYSYQVDPSGEFGRESVEEGTWSSTDIEKKSYLPYDLAQKKYNPNYKGSKK